jgi:hypothetical protein
MEAMQRAAALYQAGRLDEADAACREILAASDERHFFAWHLRSVVAARRGDAASAAEFATRALALDGANAEVLANRGAALRKLGRYQEALADYDRAIALAPASAEAHNNRGVALAALGRYDAALAAYARALELAPGFERARFNRGLVRLVLGDLEGGLADHEARWNGSDIHLGRPKFPQPVWDGAAPLAGRTILLHGEQGLGDAIQFARYVPLVAQRGARIVLHVHAPLVPLLRQLPVAQVLSFEEALPPFDTYCALMSLPLAFGTTLASIPSTVPYLAPSRERIERWRATLGEASRPIVGLAWSGSATHTNDRNRSMALAQLAPLHAVAGTLVSLQKEVRPDDADALRALGVRHFGEQLRDMEDTAALVALMDAVVSVDTSAAHLAGAMAKPVRILLPYVPDWRWLTERSDSPWYPTARLVRQPAPGDWEAVAARVAGELRQLA